MAASRRSSAAERGVLVTLSGLLGLALLKGAAGWLSGSKALLADACQSGADCAGAVTAFVGLRNARKKPNATTASRESIRSAACIVLSALLLVAGLEIGLSSARKLAQGVDEAPGWGAVVVIAAGMAAREALVRYKRREDLRLGIRPDRHLDNRSDIFASMTALVGTSGAMAGQLLDMPLLYSLDPAAGLVVSVFVLRMGYRLTNDVLRASDNFVLDAMDQQSLMEAVQRIDGVVAVDELRARELGHYIALDVAIRVNPRITVSEGQDIALRVRRQIMNRFLHISDASVQVQPYDSCYPYKSNHQEEEFGSFLQ